jgi:Pvc16 N-terminal domain
MNSWPARWPRSAAGAGDGRATAAEDRSFADVWSALGGELKPSLDIVVSMPVDIGQVTEAAAPVVELPRIDLVDRDGTMHDPPRSRRAAG